MTPPPPGSTEATWRSDMMSRVGDMRREAELSDAELEKRLALHEQLDESRFAVITKAVEAIEARFDKSDRRQLIGVVLLIVVAIGVRTTAGATILKLLGLL